METLLLQFFSALIGSLVVYVFGIRKLSIELRNIYIQKQMSEFYSPIAGYRKRIGTKSGIRSKIYDAANESWKEKCDLYSATQPMEEKQFAPYEKIFEYDKQQLQNELMPLYRKILDTFTDKYWLADEDTRAYYQDFLEFVEIWERHLAESIPGEVIQKLGHTEKNVRPFYDHIERKLSELQQEIQLQSFCKLRL